ncbi:hypothetical protein BGW39_010923, partial [Mortierella sp. 14UC]
MLKTRYNSVVIIVHDGSIGGDAHREEQIAAASGVTQESAAAVEELMGTANSIAGGGDMDAHVEAEAETVDEIMSAAAAMGLRRRVVSVAAAPGGGDVVVKSPVPMHLYPFAPASALEVSTDSIEQQPQLPQEQGQQPPQQQDKRDSVVGGQTALKVGGQEEDASSQNDSQAQPPSTLPFTIPQLDPISIILIGAPGQQGQEQQLQQHQEQGQGQELQEHLLPWSEPPLYYPPAIAAIIAASANDDSNSNNLSPSLYFDNHDPNRTLGYNLVALLFTLFFGVLILTEFVLDREDEDL